MGEPESLAGDAYRLLAAQLRFGVLGAGPHLIMITSATNGEGKSTTAANLAAALALGGTKTLLIDLDLRKPSLHGMFNLPNRGGVAAMLRDGDFAIERYSLQTTLPNLRLLPAGTVIGNPAEVLSRSAEALLLSAWATADIVIVDGPPLLAVPDAAVLTGFVPDTLCVARFQRTSGRDLRAAVDILSGLPTRIRGIVLNAVPSEQASLTGYQYETSRKKLGGWRSVLRAGKVAALASATVTAASPKKPTPAVKRVVTGTVSSRNTEF
jgi:capsular exopolysaccharide synthesis family protein